MLICIHNLVESLKRVNIMNLTDIWDDYIKKRIIKI